VIKQPTLVSELPWATAPFPQRKNLRGIPASHFTALLWWSGPLHRGRRYPPQVRGQTRSFILPSTRWISTDADKLVLRSMRDVGRDKSALVAFILR